MRVTEKRVLSLLLASGMIFLGLIVFIPNWSSKADAISPSFDLVVSADTQDDPRNTVRFF